MHFQTRGFSNTRLFNEQKRAINDVFRLLRSRQQAVAARAAADAALRQAALLQAEQDAAAQRLEAERQRAELDEAERVSSMPRIWWRPDSLAAHLVCGRQSRRVRFLCERRYLSACCRCV